MSENKGTDQLRSDRAADLCMPMYSHICKKQNNKNTFNRILAKKLIRSNCQKCIKLYLSLAVRKPAVRICKNKDADQFRDNREADQRLCFRYAGSTIPLLSESEISSL